MARASTRTLLPLERWAAILGVNPLHFNQVVSEIVGYTACDNPWKQYAWQESQAVGREDVAMAIQEAERMIMDQVGYNLRPDWVVDERLGTVRPGIPEIINIGARNIQGFRSSVQTRRGHFISGGIEAKTLLDADAAVTYSDSDGDGYDELGTITVATTVTDPAQIAVYYPGENGADEWEIRPLRNVSIAGGVATITIWKHQMVLPELLEAFSPSAVDGDDNTQFLSTVDVYQHWNDLQQQVQLMWSPMPNNCDCGSSCEECQVSTQFGCLSAKDYRLGIVSYQPATWNEATEVFDSAEFAVFRNPDRLRLWYYAGYQDTRRTYPTIQMDESWERAITYLSISLLDRTLCGCNNLEAVVKHWREELNLSLATGEVSSSYELGKRVIDNPFGATRGALFAWDRVNRSGAGIGRAVRL